MPSRPPSLSPRQPRKAWAKPIGERDDRTRGRAGVAMRERVRAEEPLCRLCSAAGITARTTEVDHIVPLADGGSNERSNLQGLCTPCHEAKSKAERAAARARRA